MPVNKPIVPEKKKPSHRESEIQKASVLWFNYQYPQHRYLLFSVPNGGFRNKLEAYLLKAEGVKAGVSDLVMLIPNKEFHGLCIEFKVAGGKQTKDQLNFELSAINQGYKYVIVRDCNQFIIEISKYLKNI